MTTYDYGQMQTRITATVRSNGVGGITGAAMQQLLLDQLDFSAAGGAANAAASAIQAANSATAAAASAASIAGGAAPALGSVVPPSFEATMLNQIDPHDGSFSYPLRNLLYNGDFQIWTTRPANGVAVSAGAGVGFGMGQISDSWYGGPGQGSQYQHSRIVTDALKDEKAGQWTWLTAAGTSDSEYASIPAPGVRFTWLEYDGHLDLQGFVGEIVTIEGDILCTSPIQIVPIVWYSMGTPQWAVNQQIYVGDCRINGGLVYRCTTAGITMTSGAGPSGTGSSIADGSVIWAYLGPLFGAETQNYEAGADTNTVKIANGVPGPNAGVVSTNVWSHFKRSIRLPDLTGFAPPQGGSYLGVGFDVYHTDILGPTIMLKNLQVYAGVVTPRRRERLLKPMKEYNSNGMLQMLKLYIGLVNGSIAGVARAAGVVTISGTTPALTGPSINTGAVSRTGAGAYIIPFQSNLPDGNYAVSLNAHTAAGAPLIVGYTNKAANGFSILITDNAGAAVDPSSFDFAVFRG